MSECCCRGTREVQLDSATGESARGGMVGADDGFVVTGVVGSWEMSIRSGEGTGVLAGDDGGVWWRTISRGGLM